MEKLIDTKIFEKFMEGRGITIDEFCRECRVPRKVYSQLEVGDYDFDIVYLFRMAKVMNIEVCEFFRKERK